MNHIYHHFPIEKVLKSWSAEEERPCFDYVFEERLLFLILLLLLIIVLLLFVKVTSSTPKLCVGVSFGESCIILLGDKRVLARKSFIIT